MLYETRTASPRYAALGARMVLTVAGAAALIVSMFFTWVDGIKGTELSDQVLWRMNPHATGTFVATVGFGALVLGVVAIVGMALSTGWLTRLAGVIGIAAFVLFAVEVYRAPGVHEIELGAWLALAGSVVLLVAGFFGRTDTVVARSTADGRIIDET